MNRDYSRAAITRTLSMLVEKRLNARRLYWSAEVTFDKDTDHERRIDYVGFKPYAPESRYECYSVELGTFECYEVKSCLEDFTSGHGLSFYGDENYLVCEPKLADCLRERGILPDGVHILVPDRTHTKLLHRWGHASYNRPQHRRKTAAEMLWAITLAHKGNEYMQQHESLEPLPEEDTMAQAMTFLPGHENDPATWEETK